MDAKKPVKRGRSGTPHARRADGSHRVAREDLASSPKRPRPADRDARQPAPRGDGIRKGLPERASEVGSKRERAPKQVVPPDGTRKGRPRRATGNGHEGGFGPFARGSEGRPAARRTDERATPDRADKRESPVRSAAREAIARASSPRERSALRLVRRDERPSVIEGPSRRPTRAPKAAGAPPARRAEQVQPTAVPRSARGATRIHDAVLRAARALERGYEREAVRILRPQRELHPKAPDVRELLGIALYRLGRWAPARKELEAFVELTGSATQHPVLMDCARALGRHTRVEALWEELRAASPGAEIMTEGRIVAAGSLADRGRTPEAIKLLERGPLSPKRVAEHHLRLWYALADLHERAGDLPGARSLFRKVSSKDPAFIDVAERLAALS